MPNLIDSFVVSLGLDPTDFDKNQKESIENLRKLEEQSHKTHKNVQEHTSATTEAFAKLKEELIGVAAAYFSLDAAKDFIKDQTNIAIATGRVSESVGVSIEKLSSWEGVGKKLHVSSESIVGAFEKIDQAAFDAQHGLLNPEIIRAFNQLHLNTGILSDQALSNEDRIYKLQEALNSVSEQEAFNWGRRAGFSAEFISMMRDTNGTLKEQIKEQYELNHLSKEDEQLALSRAKAWDLLANVTESFFKHALNVFTLLLSGHFGQRYDEVQKKWVDKKWIGFSGAWDKLFGKEPSETDNQISDIPSGKLKSLLESGKASSTDIPYLLSIEQKLEGSGEQSISPAGAVGKNQILPSTARALGFDANKLFDPAYNDMVAETLLHQLADRYKGNIDLIMADYNGGPRAANSLAKTGDPGNWETRKYIAHLHSLLASGAISSGGSKTVNIGKIDVHTQATDAKGIAVDIKPNLDRFITMSMANSGPQ